MRTPENITKTTVLLESLDAVFRIQPERRLRPNATHLAEPGHLNLLTSLGPLDLLGEIGHSHLDYERLLPHSNTLTVGGGLQIQVLNLETLIELKEELAGQKQERSSLSLLTYETPERSAGSESRSRHHQRLLAIANRGSVANRDYRHATIHDSLKLNLGAAYLPPRPQTSLFDDLAPDNEDDGDEEFFN